MGRTPLGEEGRTVKATLRITAQESAYLTERFGSDGKGLRSLLDEHMQRGRYGARTTYPGEADLLRREALDGDLPGPPGLSDAEMAFAAEVGASVPLMSDEEMAAALALDQVKQSLPIGEGLAEEGRRLASQREDLIAAGVDPSLLDVPLAPLPGIPAPHRHKRGVVLRTEFEAGTKTRVYACTVEGCLVELR